VDIHEAGLADGFVHRVDRVAITAGGFATGENIRAPGAKNVVFG
jgi:hypothetical protein